MSAAEYATYKAVNLIGFEDSASAMNFAKTDSVDTPEVMHHITTRLSPMARFLAPGKGIALIVSTDGREADVIGIERLDSAPTTHTDTTAEVERLRAVLQAIWDKFLHADEDSLTLSGTLAHMARKALKQGGAA